MTSRWPVRMARAMRASPKVVEIHGRATAIELLGALGENTEILVVMSLTACQGERHEQDHPRRLRRHLDGRASY
jgi:hypothetical protein